MKITMNTLDGVTLKTKNKYVNEDIAVAVDQAVVDEIYQDGFQQGVASVPPNKMPSLIDGSLTELTAEDFGGVTSIISYAFAYVTSLASVTIPNTVTSLGSYVFRGTSITNLVIPNSVTTLGDSRTFAYMEELTNVTIGNGIKTWGSYTFQECPKLKTVNMAEGLTSIGGSAFYGCSSLTSVTIGSAVKSIGNWAFGLCSSLTSLTIPASVTKIDSYSLQIGSSANKGTITFLSTTPPSIQSNTFTASYLEKIIVPKGYGETYKTATNFSNFADYIVESDT